jgi:hypothetical protein
MCSEVVLLNAAVRAHLVTQGYKLTALTLSEEGGSNIPAALPQHAASLIDLFQGHAKKIAAAEARQVCILPFSPHTLSAPASLFEMGQLPVPLPQPST